MNNGIFSILDFGASPDGSRSSTDSIRRTIEECASRGGGMVMVPPGRYLTGAILLKSNMEFHISAGAEIVFSDKPEDYPILRTRWEGTECYALSPMVYGKNLINVSITGKGTLDGCGASWWDYLRFVRSGRVAADDHECLRVLADLNRDILARTGSGGGGIETNYLRPPLIQFNSCYNVTITGITARNSAFWNTHILYCSDVSIRHARFENPPDAPNTDGLDIDSSSGVRVSDCFFDVGDDCIALKSGIDEDGRRVGKPTENVTITNCLMKRGHGAVVLGSECAGGIRNVVVTNCIFSNTDRGIRIKSRRGRGGFVENLVVSNIIMENTLCPIVCNLYYRCGIKPGELAYARSKDRAEVTEKTPYVRNINISGISSVRARSACGVFFGLPEMPIEEVAIRDSYFEMDDAGEIAIPAMDFDNTMAKKRGFFGYNLKGFDFSNIAIKGAEGKAIDFGKSADMRSRGIRSIPG
jgi:polygalacturonase